MSDREARIAWFKAEILPHEGALRRLLSRILGAGGDMEDLAAEAMTRAYGAPDFLRISGGRNYLLTIARNLVRDAARRRKIIAFDTIADLDLLAVRDEQPNAEDIVSARDELRHVERAVAALPPKCKSVFLLRRVEGLSVIEVADRLGISVSTVEKHLARALTGLAETLAESETSAGLKSGYTWRNRRHRR